MAEVSKEELRRRIHVVLQTWADDQDAGKPTFDPYDQWAACIEVLQSVEPLLARMAGPGEVVVPMEQIDEWRTAVQSWGAYVSDYFKDKHGFADDLATFDKYLAARPNGESK